VGLVADAAGLSAAAPRVWGRAAVALVVALAAVCMMVPAAQAQQVAFQGSNGSLWLYTPLNPVGRDQHAGMAAGTSPSINNWGITAFQANTGKLDVTGKGDLHLGMMAGTSPAIDDGGQVAFQANSGELWQVGGDSNNNSWGLGMMPGNSPSIGHESGSQLELDNTVAFQASTGHLWNLFKTDQGRSGSTAQAMAAGTSPSINDDGAVAFQGSNGSLGPNERGRSSGSSRGDDGGYQPEHQWLRGDRVPGKHRPSLDNQRWRYWPGDGGGYHPEHRRLRYGRVPGAQRQSLVLERKLH
jgi:hypothetical protein